MELGVVRPGYGAVKNPYSTRARTPQSEFETKIAAMRESSYAEETRERMPKISGKQEKTIGYLDILQERMQDTTESTSCTYPTADPKKDDIRYITWYTEEGIFCRKAGRAEGYEWSISFENKEQYDKVMEFVGQFSSDWNLRFAAHENFWTDFLNDEIDMDGFMKFMEGTDKGIPDYSITRGDSMYIDKEKIQWAKYLNPLGFKVYTGEEFLKQQAEIISANRAKLSRITDSYDV